MLKNKRLYAVTMALLICFLATGCRGKNNTIDKTDTETLYLFNSKGENAEQFKKMCDDFTKETGIPTSPFTVGSGQDALEPLRTQMNSKNPPAIFSMQGLKELPEWVESGRVLDLSTVENQELKAIADSIPTEMRLTADGKTNYGIPFNVEGYGYMVDKRMLEALFGKDNAEDVYEDLKECSYTEFTTFTDAVTEYIASPSARSVTLDGDTYTFSATKQGLAEKLNGVFAFAGAEKWTYGDHLINVALNAVFPDARSAENASAKDVDELKKPLLAYTEALDYVSNHAAGLKGATKRGKDLISQANFGYDQSIQMYADSNALFLQQGNWAYANIAKINKDVAMNSIFVPIKLPLTEEMIKTGKSVEDINSSIPVYVPNYYAINAKASDTAKKHAMEFLVWMQKPENVQKYVIDSFEAIPFDADSNMKINNSLSVSILDYLDDGDVLSAPYHGAPNTWSSEVVGKELMEKYITKETWAKEDYEAISSFATSQWKQMKDLK